MNYPGQCETRKKMVHEYYDIEKFNYSSRLWCHALTVNCRPVNEYKIKSTIHLSQSRCECSLETHLACIFCYIWVCLRNIEPNFLMLICWFLYLHYSLCIQIWSKWAVRTDSVFRNVGSKIYMPGNHPKERMQQAVRTLLRCL